MNDPFFRILAAFVVGLFVGLTARAFLFAPWTRALMHRGRVSMWRIFLMHLRGNPVNLILDAHLALVQAGFKSKIDQVEAKYVATLPRIETAEELMRLVLEDPQAPRRRRVK